MFIERGLALVDQAERRILSSQPDSDLHSSEDCPLCLLQQLRVYELSQQLEQRTRQILFGYRWTRRLAQGRLLRRD